MPVVNRIMGTIVNIGRSIPFMSKVMESAFRELGKGIIEAAIAGVVGGGGMGQIAIVYGMHRHRTDVLVYTIITPVIIVQLVQAIGQFISRKLDKR